MSVHGTERRLNQRPRVAFEARWRSRVRDVCVELPSRSRRTISEHRRRRRLIDRKVSDQSRQGLDWTNFFLADVQMGFGAFLAFYLAEFDWSVQSVGLALSIGGLAGVVAQIPGGAIADAVRWKRALAALGILMIVVSAIILALRPSFPFVVTAEILHGATAGIVGPAIAAISLGLAGRRGMSCRVGRNFRFAAAGNALTAALMGTLGVYLSKSAIFFTAAALCIPTLIALSRIRPDEIDYARARNATKRDHSLDFQRVADLTRNRNLLIFAGGLMLFHFSNASLLPLVGENLGHSKLALSSLFMAGLIIVPQVVVAVLAPWIGYWSELWGRKPLLLLDRVGDQREQQGAHGFDREASHDGRADARRDHRRDRDGADDLGDHRSHHRHGTLQPGAGRGWDVDRYFRCAQHERLGIGCATFRYRSHISRHGDRNGCRNGAPVGVPAGNEARAIR